MRGRLRLVSDWAGSDGGGPCSFRLDGWFDGRHWCRDNDLALFRGGWLGIVFLVRFALFRGARRVRGKVVLLLRFQRGRGRPDGIDVAEKVGQSVRGHRLIIRMMTQGKVFGYKSSIKPGRESDIESPLFSFFEIEMESILVFKD